MTKPGPRYWRGAGDVQGTSTDTRRRGRWGVEPTRVVALWPGALTLGIYLCTLAPTVTGEDGGELITAAYCFGVPHPPGYPLWTMLCGVWTHCVPFGSVAWRANLLSAVCLAAATVFVAQTLKTIGFRWSVAGATAVACSLTTAIWSQAVIAEVYTLNYLLMALLVWAVGQWHAEGRRGWLVWGALVFGLGMSNHQIIGFAGLGLCIWAIYRCPALMRDWTLAGRCLAFFALGLTPYVYLLWAGGREAPVNWGETATLAAAWEHVSRGQYKSESSIEAKIPATTAWILAKLYYGLRWEIRNFTPLLAPLLVTGMVWLYRRSNVRPWFWWVVVLGFCCGPLYLYIGGPRMDRQDEFVQKVFLTPLALVSAVPLAGGMTWLVAAISRAGIFARRRRRLVVRTAVACAVVAVPLVAHWRDNNMRHYWYAHDHARNLLAGMLPGAIVFPSGDHNTFPLVYLIHVEGYRPDVTVADKYGYIDLALYADMPNNPGKPRTREQRQDIEEWIIRHARRPVYYTVKKSCPVEKTTTVAVGLVYHLLPEGKSCDTEKCWSEIRYRNLEDVGAPEDYAAANILADYYYALGLWAMDTGRPEDGREYFKKSVQHAWNIKEIYNNIGSALAEGGMLDEAVAYYEQAARLDWRYAPGRWNLAKIFKSIGRFSWSAKVFEDLTLATPGDFRPFGELGFLYRDHLNDIAQARYWWYESLRLNPRQGQIIQALAQDGLSGGSFPGAPTSRPAGAAADGQAEATPGMAQTAILEGMPRGDGTD